LSEKDGRTSPVVFVDEAPPDLPQTKPDSLSRRQLLLRSLWATGIAATAWFLPPEIRKSLSTAHADHFFPACPMGGGARYCGSQHGTCDTCSGGLRTPYCRFIWAECWDCDNCSDCRTGGCSFVLHGYTICCMDGWLCGPCTAGMYGTDCSQICF
jgi:hypothetical protein